MTETRQLLSALREINSSETRIVARLTPSLIGMFGSPSMFDIFLADLDVALNSGTLPGNLRRRATNLTGTFIPQVAELNGVKDFGSTPASAADVRTLSVGSPAERKRGVAVILSALNAILVEVQKIG
jgi:hypothetical protein